MRQPGQEEIGGERIKAVKGRQVDSSPQELLAEHAADRRSALMGRRRQAFDGRLPDRLQIAVHPLQRRRPWLFNEEAKRLGKPAKREENNQWGQHNSRYEGGAPAEDRKSTRLNSSH